MDLLRLEDIKGLKLQNRVICQRTWSLSNFVKTLFKKIVILYKKVTYSIYKSVLGKETVTSQSSYFCV